MLVFQLLVFGEGLTNVGNIFWKTTNKRNIEKKKIKKVKKERKKENKKKIDDTDLNSNKVKRRI